MNNSKIRSKEYIDERNIILANNKYRAIFDTGATSNMICSGLLGELKNVKLNNEVKEYVNFDGTSNKTLGSVDLKFKYEGKEFKGKFYVIKNEKEKSILLSNTFVKRVDKKSKKLPIKCNINTGDQPAISWNRPIRSLKDRADFELLLEDLERRNIIEPSNSSWLNPVVLTRKRNGDLRFCVDFRRLNDLVVLDEFEIPRINEIMVALRDMKYFTLLDLKDGYFNVKLNENDKEKTTFYTGKRLMQFTRMPQGFKNSPAIF